MSNYVAQQRMTRGTPALGRLFVLLYGVICYLIFFGTFLYAIGFVGNLLVPKAIDTGATSSFGEALLIDLLLLGLFAVQHSGMARPGFKTWWTRMVPRPIERSTYVLFASSSLILLFAFWRPLPMTIWQVDNGLLQGLIRGLFGLGWLTVLFGTFLINHFDLFGLRQSYLHARGEQYTELGFRTPLLYKVIRHPIMLGFMIAFWSTAHMTLGHLLFAGATTGYILIAIQLEERDLLRYFGDTYRAYRRMTPMLIPWPIKSK